ATSGGFGLVGMDERIRMTGGRLKAGPTSGGFSVTATIPLDGQADATPPASHQQLAQARRNVRRSMFEAIWLPVAGGATLLAIVFGYNLYMSSRAVLDAEVYNTLRLGESRSAVLPRLPEMQADDSRRPPGAPPDPRTTDECRFYRTTARELSPVYRLCFGDGRLTHKAKLKITRP
ncbi:hypothetical protein ACFQ07_17325, partial [Actinomadura adrarensis]